MSYSVNPLLQSVELPRDKFKAPIQCLCPALSATVVLGSKLIQGMISSAKAVAISTTVFIYDPSATPTIFQRMNFLRRFIGRR